MVAQVLGEEDDGHAATPDLTIEAVAAPDGVGGQIEWSIVQRCNSAKAGIWYAGGGGGQGRRPGAVLAPGPGIFPTSQL